MVILEDAPEITPTFEEPKVTSEDCKQLGNDCVKLENFKEAILHYTKGLKLSKQDDGAHQGLQVLLYSNRSLCYLKLKQYYFANEDAEQVINLKPDWIKGFFRKAEVMRETGQYDSALINYGRSLQLAPNDMNIINLARKTAALSNREQILESRVPWVGSGVGIILGILIALADQFLTAKPSMKHPTIKVLLVIVISCLGFFIAKLCRYYIKLKRKSLMEPPTDFFEEYNNDPVNENEENIPKQKRNKYTKSQARLRFKKGKT